MKNVKSITEIAKSYIAERDPEALAALQKRLDAFDGDFDAVVKALKPVPPKKAETGLVPDSAFKNPEYAKKWPTNRLWIHAPENYDSRKAYGLLIFLHGGGRGVENHAPKNYFGPDNGIGDILKNTGRIVCMPSALPNNKSFARWHLPEVDEYIADVIREMSERYHIDPNNIVLGGHSMGGMGAYHMAHRFADRFPTVLTSAGHWDFACWNALKGTTLWVSQAINDTTLFRRRHGTDIEFARLARRRLEESGVDFVYREHLGRHHSGHMRRIFREWLRFADTVRRDPAYRHVVAVTPRGLSPWSDFKRHRTPLGAAQNYIDFHDIAEAPHARWVTIDAIGDETIIFDMAVMSDCRDEVEADWNEFNLKIKRKHVPGGIVEAYIEDDKTIEVTPVNVKKFTLWLSPEMVDLNKVRVVVQGFEKFNGPVKPSLGTLLESYRRRRDWGMLYPAKLTFEDDGTWKQSDQINAVPARI